MKKIKITALILCASMLAGTTNQYNVYVFALKAPVERVKGTIRTPAIKLQEFMDGLDTDAEGNTGNIVAVGRIIGHYSAK